MSKKRPNIVQIDSNTHKKLKILAAQLDCTMGDIVIDSVDFLYGLLIIEKPKISRNDVKTIANKVIRGVVR
jgi:hypothetical protein